MAELSKEDIEALGHDVGSLREVIVTAVNTAVDNRAKRWRRIITALAVVICIQFLGLGGLGLVALAQHHQGDDLGAQNDRLTAVITQQSSDTLQRRIDACQRDNTSRAASRTQAQTSASAFTQFAALLVGNSQITPEIKQQLTQFQAKVVQPFLDLANDKTGPNTPRNCDAITADNSVP